MNASNKVECPACASGEVLFKAAIHQVVCTKCFNLFAPPTAMEPQTKPLNHRKVFLSYGHDVACGELAQRIRSDLESRGIEVWVDQERMEFGDEWRRAITAGLTPLITCTSPDSYLSTGTYVFRGSFVRFG